MPRPQRTPAFKRHRPAPRMAPGPPAPLTDKVDWHRIVEPRERYRIFYRDRDGETSERTIELLKVGTFGGHTYFSVMHAGQPKTFRADRIASVVAQLTTGHPSSIVPAITYHDQLPKFPLPNARYQMPTIAVGNRTWWVDLNLYTCKCPEGRRRSGRGYEPGMVGFVCPHMARAILDYLPADADWPPELLDFLRDPRKVHIDNLR